MDAPVTRRRLIVAVVISAVLAAVAGAAGGAALSTAVVDRGPRGHVGPPGPQGDPGDAAVVDPEDVYSAIEDKPGRVADAIQSMLDAKAIQPQLRPDPQDVQADLRDLCSQLEESKALRDETLACP
jgi:hypothetical protein